jgi:hypothetical protein
LGEAKDGFSMIAADTHDARVPIITVGFGIEVLTITAQAMAFAGVGGLLGGLPV